MNSTTRVVLTVVLCTGLLILWTQLFPPTEVKAPPPPAAKGSGKEPSARADAKARPSSRPATQRRSDRGQPGTGRAIDPEGQQVSVKMAGAVARFSDTGGTLRSVRLTARRYREKRGGKLEAVELVSSKKHKGPWQLITSFPDSDFVVPEDARFRLVRRGERDVEYRFRSENIALAKHYRVDATRPLVWLTVTLRNLSSSALVHNLRVSLFSRQDRNASKPGWANPYPRIPMILCRANDELHRRSLDAITGEGGGCTAAGCGMGEGPVAAVGSVGWVAVDDRYFLTGLVPQGADTDRHCRLDRRSGDDEIIEASIRFAEGRLAPQEQVQRRFAVFVGAKSLDVLDTVTTADNADAHLSESIEFGWFAVLCRPMLGLLRVFERVFGNWGVAIIFLTLVIKLLTFYPTAKSMRSMKAMQKLKPKMDELREKYKGDKQRLNQEMMSLYRVHKVNPVGGCLPMLIQMPIWFALYRTLGNAVELYRSPFFGWVSDLTAPDPYYILPVAMGLAMFGQQAITPQPVEGPQAKMLKYFMPGMFTVMMLALPAGLTLYIFVNTLLTMGHQWYMNRSDNDPQPSSRPGAIPRQASPVARAGSRGTSGSGTGSTTEASPAAESRARSGQRSKKRNRRRRTKGG